MQINGLSQIGGNTRYQPRIADSTSTESKPNPDTFITDKRPADAPVVSQPQALGPQGPLQMISGNVSLDLYFSRTESVSVDAQRNTSNGSEKYHGEYTRSIEAGLSIDFSFDALFNGTKDKLAKLDPSVMSEWSQAASDLKNLKDESYTQFVKATDSLFNEIEKQLGMGPEGLDSAADFFKGEVNGFITDVKAAMLAQDSTPSPQSTNSGTGIESLLDSAKGKIPADLKSYLESMLNKLQDSGKDQATDTSASLLKKFRDLYQNLTSRLEKPEDSPEKPGNTGEKTNASESGNDKVGEAKDLAGLEHYPQMEDTRPIANSGYQAEKAARYEYQYSHFYQKTTYSSATVQNMDAVAPAQDNSQVNVAA